MFNITELSCRVCLEERDILINIYDELEELNTNLSTLLETCAGLQINSNDILPKYICEDCTRELLITSRFREKCDKSKKILHELLENSKAIENNESFNSSDLIEYGIDDATNIDIEDLIIQDSATDEEIDPVELIDELEKKDQHFVLSPWIEDITEPTKATALPNKSEHENVIDEASLSKDYSNKFEDHSNPEVPTEEVNVSWENICVTTKSLSRKSKKPHTFKCDVCGAIFKQAINLQKHFQKSHDTIYCYTCSKCEHWFSLETELHKHSENCICLITNTEKAENTKLKAENILIGTAVEREPNRKCMYCERDFPTPFALRMHLRSHTGERPFQCEYCPKSFKTQYQLNVHHKRHTGQADFICTICNKTFYEQSNLIVHMRSHTGERPHICMICKKTFTRVFLLQFHMRTHTGEKPFKCIYCDRRFRQNTDLRCHLAIHTGQKQHTCISCGKSYIKRSHLVQHMRKHRIPINCAQYSETVQFEKVHSTEELSTEADIGENYVQNPEILHSFGEIVESEHIVTNTDNFLL